MDLVEEDTSDVPVQVGFTQCKLLLVIVPSVFQTYKFHRIGDLDQINMKDAKDAVMVDVMGICKFVFLAILSRQEMTSCPRSFGESTDIVTKLGKEMTKREIILVDQSAAEATTILYVFYLL